PAPSAARQSREHVRGAVGLVTCLASGALDGREAAPAAPEAPAGPSNRRSSPAASEENTMFITYEVSLQVIQSLRPLLPRIEQHDRDLADQIKRAASSVVLNLAEGQRLTKGNRPKHFTIAHGSANEVRAALQTALAWGWIEDASQQLAVVDRLLALLWRL